MYVSQYLIDRFEANLGRVNHQRSNNDERESKCFKRRSSGENYNKLKTTKKEPMMKFSLALIVSAVSGTSLGGSLVEAMYETLQAAKSDDSWLQRGDDIGDEWWLADMDEMYDLGSDIWYVGDADQDDELHTIGTKIIGQSDCDQSAALLGAWDDEDDDNIWSLEDFEDDEDADDWGPLTSEVPKGSTSLNAPKEPKDDWVYYEEAENDEDSADWGPLTSEVKKGSTSLNGAAEVSDELFFFDDEDEGD